MSQSSLMSILWISMFLIISSLILQNNLSIIQLIINLMMTTFFSCLIMTNFSSLSFYSFIVFLMIIGGLIILFMMFLSLISNQYINLYPNKIIKLFMLFLMIYFLIKFTPLMNNFLNNLYFNKFNWLIFLDMSISKMKFSYWLININQIYNYPINMIFILLMFFLLMILIFVTKICLNNCKPLRSQFL